jgi:hypothetical protein
MIQKIFPALILLLMPFGFCRSQAFVKTIDLLNRPDNSGSLVIYQNPSIDTLISRHVIANRKVRTLEGTQGMQGFRIQIYNSSVRTAREESAKARAEFINIFPDLVSYAQYQEPGWFMVRVGDYRTKTESYKDLLMVRKEFPNAYLVPAVINYPDQIKK